MTASHLLGTDHLGRDLLSRIMAGGWRTALVVFRLASSHLPAGHCSAPALPYWVAGRARIAALLRILHHRPDADHRAHDGGGFRSDAHDGGAGARPCGHWADGPVCPFLSQRVLGQTFVHATEALGVPPFRMIIRHLLPNILPLMVTHTGNQAGFAVTAYASLAFIGLGADPSKPDWGSMLFEYRVFIFDHPSLMIWPGVAIAMTVGTLNALFDTAD